MIRTTIRLSTLLLALGAMVGCQTAPRFAWWKNDKSAVDSSVVARSATPPALPSAQSTPQAVAIAGLTPAATPSSANLAAATPAVAGATTPSISPPSIPPSVAIPVTSSATLANAPAATYPTDSPLADKLVPTPNSKLIGSLTPAAPKALPPTSSAAYSDSNAAKIAAVPASGPYDPNGYKPAAAHSTSDLDGNNPDAVDRYATSAAPSTPSMRPMAAMPPAPMTSGGTLASDPADRYGSPRTPSAPPAVSGATSLMDPAAIAADRYSNPNLPVLGSKISQPTSTPIASAPAPGSSPLGGTTASASPVSAMSPMTTPIPQAAPTVNLVAAPGQYRPGHTSSYTPTSATTAMEVATRPAPPSATNVSTPDSTTPASQPWATPGATVPANGARY